eukprot:gene35691-44017_t
MAVIPPEGEAAPHSAFPRRNRLRKDNINSLDQSSSSIYSVATQNTTSAHTPGSGPATTPTTHKHVKLQIPNVVMYKKVVESPKAEEEPASLIRSYLDVPLPVQPWNVPVSEPANEAVLDLMSRPITSLLESTTQDSAVISYFSNTRQFKAVRPAMVLKQTSQVKVDESKEKPSEPLVVIAKGQPGRKASKNHSLHNSPAVVEERKHIHSSGAHNAAVSSHEDLDLDAMDSELIIRRLSSHDEHGQSAEILSRVRAESALDPLDPMTHGQLDVSSDLMEDVFVEAERTGLSPPIDELLKSVGVTVLGEESDEKQITAADLFTENTRTSPQAVPTKTPDLADHHAVAPPLHPSPRSRPRQIQYNTHEVFLSPTAPALVQPLDRILVPSSAAVAIVAPSEGPPTYLYNNPRKIKMPVRLQQLSRVYHNRHRKYDTPQGMSAMVNKPRSPPKQGVLPDALLAEHIQHHQNAAIRSPLLPSSNL